MGYTHRIFMYGLAVFLAVPFLTGCPSGSDKVRVDFVGTPRIGYAALTVRFRADVEAIPPYVIGAKFRGLDRPTISILDYVWTFGDGSVGKGKTPIHVYTKPGKYDVGLTVTVREETLDENGLKTSSVSYVNEYKVEYIIVLSPNQPPVANAGPDRVATLNQALTLDGTESYDPDDDEITYAWTAAVQDGGTGDAPFVLEDADTATPHFTAAVHGTYVVTLVVNDGQVDSLPDTAVITTDQVPPDIDFGQTGTDAETIHVECGSTTFPQPTATDNQDGDLTQDLVVVGTVDLNTPGTYVLSYTVTDASGNTSTPFVLTVIVEDTTPPVITLLGDAQMTIECKSPFIDPGATALDACEGDVPVVTDGAVDNNTPGVYTLTYDATDSAGNAATQVTRTVTVVDTTPPVITLLGDAQMTIECPNPFTDPGATAADVCDPEVPVRVGGDTVDTSTPGVYTLTYDATDNTGNAAAQVTRTVTVVDTTPPVITLNGNAQMTVECPNPFTDPGATALDACAGDVPVQIGGDDVDPSVPGVYTLTYDASDNAGNAAAQVIRTVTVVDTTPPVITLIGDAQMTVECPNPFTDPGATALDACAGDVPVQVGGETVDTSVPGIYTLTYDASDNAGNAAAQVLRTVTVVDTTPPVITLIGDAQMTVECPNPFTDPGATATDLCSGDLRIQTGGDDVDTSVPGVYTLTYDASDNAGNAAAQVIRTVTVVDTTPPVITLLGDAQIAIECPNPFTDPGATATDLCSGDLRIQTGGDDVDTSVPGVYTLTYDATDNAGNAATQVIRTVTVVDTTPPVISLLGNAQITIECPNPFTDPGATALDACEGEIPISGDDFDKVGGDQMDTSVPGVYTLTYDAVDSAGNAATQVIRTVTVVDTTPPVITLLGDAQITIECPNPFTDPGATALDACAGDVPVQVGGDSVDTSSPGVYTLTYDATDSAGNAATQATRTVTVVDTTPPVITLEGDAQVTVECPNPFTDPGATALDACAGDVPVQVGGDSVDTSSPGVYTLTYDATDNAGNAATQATRTVTVVDTTPPVITLEGDAQITVECTGQFSDPGASALDACAGQVSVQVGGDQVDTSAPGIYTLTYDATDNAGNAATQVIRTVAVVDTTPPVITLIGDAQVTIECPNPFDDPGAEVMDGCDPDVSVQVGGDQVNTSVPGIYTITYDATDSAGNTATQVIRTVTVVDTTPPVITLLGDAQMTVECPNPFTDPGATALDACEGNVLVQVGGDEVDTSVPGTYTLTYDATDNAGNAATQVLRAVTVVDTTPPVLSLIGNAQIDWECGTPFVDPGATVADACDPTLGYQTGGDVVDVMSKATYVITYDATDNAGNAATQVTRSVTVVDTNGPVISLIGDADMTVECYGQFQDPGATALDACEGPVQVSVGGDTVDTSVLGSYTLTYDAVDGAGNPATQVIRTVTVADTQPPVMQLNGQTEMTVQCGDSYYPPFVYAMDDCQGELPVTTGGDTVDPWTPGVYEITFDAQDNSGNAATQIVVTVTVIDTLAPYITLLDGDTYYMYCGQDYMEPGATAYDLCGGELTNDIVISGDPVDPDTPGTYTVTYDVTDANSNAADQQERTVYVIGPCYGDGAACPDDGATLGGCILFANFEDDDNGFTPTGLWTRTNLCAATLQPGGATYVESFLNPLTCTYDTGVQETGSLTSPTLDLTAYAGGTVTLRFDYLCETENHGQYDRASVWISTDGGANYTLRADNNDDYVPIEAPVQICDDGSGAEGEGEFEGFFEGQPPFEGQPSVAAAKGTPTWHTALLDISAAAGFSEVVIQFTFDSIDAYGNAYYGFSIDNLCVSVKAAP